MDGKLAGRFTLENRLQTKDAASLFIGGGLDATSGEARVLAAATDDVRIYSGIKYPVEANTALGSAVYDRKDDRP